MSKHTDKAGLPPGSIIFTGNKKVDNVFVHYLSYNGERCADEVFDSNNYDSIPNPKKGLINWYDIRGMHNTDLIGQLGEKFKKHPLILEGIADTYQRPKFEEYEGGNFITMRAITFDKITQKIKKEHVAIYFNDGLITTFQETESDLFFQVRKRINSSSGRIRQRGADYLAYALIDVLVDNYYIVLEQMEEHIESLEERMLEIQDIEDKNSIHSLKKELLVLRKSVAPLREAISKFSKSESNFIQDTSIVYIRDLYEHTIQVMDTIDGYRDILNGLQDLFISEVSFKMNKVMQLLTLISVIFIPLTFLAGIYGMNFEYIPELKVENGYFILLGVMFVIFIGMVIYFKKKKWF